MSIRTPEEPPALAPYELTGEERSRLEDLQELINGRSMRALRLEPGQRVLDVGAGLGHMTCLMAEAVGPSGRVVGVEAQPWLYHLARMRALTECSAAVRPDLRCGEAQDMPLEPHEWGLFDVVHGRFLFHGVTDRERLVGNLLKAVRPGGRLVLEDDDHALFRMWPESPEVLDLWHAFMAVIGGARSDPRVGSDLVRLLSHAGARPQRAESLSLSGCQGDARFPLLHANFMSLMRGAGRRIVEQHFLSSADVQRGLDAFEAWGQRDDAVIWYSTCWAEALRTES